MRSIHILTVILGIAGTAALCLAWVSPWGITHTNDTTCNTKVCQRACRVCCLHFNPDNKSPGYLACIGTCTGLPFQCMEPGGPGGEF